MENKSGRKKWVKRIAVIFLVMMLLLTFFSNTIMNHSLAQVSTEEIVSDSVSAKVRGTGVVEAGSATEIKIKESREVTEVLVKAGDTVNKGDTLIQLAEGESQELDVAKKELEDLKEAYDDKILLEEIDREIVSAAEGGGINKATAAARLSSLSATVKQAKAKADDLQKRIDAMENGTDSLAIAVKNAARETNQANTAVEEAQNKFEAFGMDEAEVESLYETERDEQVERAKAALDALRAAKRTAAERLSAQTKAEGELEEKKSELSLELLGANAELTQANEEHEKYLSELTLVNTMKAEYEAIKAKEKQVEELALNNVGDEIKATVSGKIAAVNIEKGETITPDVPVVSIQEEGKGYTLSFSVTKDQAAKVNKGDVASISDAWYYGDMTVTLTDIKADPENPSKSRILVFGIDGDVEIGQNMTVSVGEKSTKFDYVVPNSAIREDSNGNFILVLRSKSSPLGNRYIATRVNVEILRADDAKTAVSGALEGGEYVITTSNKMVNVGDYVRLAK